MHGRGTGYDTAICRAPALANRGAESHCTTILYHPIPTAMSLSRYSGGSDLDLLRREMDRLFRDFLPAREGGDSSNAMWAPRTDLSETDDAFVLTMDLPGISPDDVEITFEEGALNISGERQFTQEQERGQYHRIERSHGRFFRSFRFGNNADPDRIDADFEDGVLTIKVGKVEERKPRRIEVGRSKGRRKQLETAGAKDGSNN
jgi:HSP20 family protein